MTIRSKRSKIFGTVAALGLGALQLFTGNAMGQSKPKITYDFEINPKGDTTAVIRTKTKYNEKGEALSVNKLKVFSSGAFKVEKGTKFPNLFASREDQFRLAPFQTRRAAEDEAKRLELIFFGQ